MLLDSRQLPANVVIECEVCIVGAGPAGITLAKELIGQDFRVCLLESGDVEFKEEIQDLCAGETVGDKFQPLHVIRRRQLGGLAHDWCAQINQQQVGLRYMPLDKLDFEKRDGVPYSGWPFSKSDLNPFYERAQSFCKLGSLAYEAIDWENAATPKLCLNDQIVTTSMFQFGPKDIFIDEYCQEISKSTNITTYLNANVVEIETDDTAKNITRVRVANLQDQQFWVAAKIFVLATGGIENARLLLMSNKVQKTGLGNQNDVVGRFFMDHPLIYGGVLIPKSRKIFNSTALYDLRVVKNVSVMGKLNIAAAVLRNQQLLSISMLLFPRDRYYHTPSRTALKILLAEFRQRKIPKDLHKYLMTIVIDLPGLVLHLYKHHWQKDSDIDASLTHGGWSARSHKEQKFAMFQILHQSEQAPHPDNRVTLSSTLDKLGCPQAKLDWHWTATDINSIKKSQAIVAEEIDRSGLGKFEIDRKGDLPNLMSASTHHNMGTTRMHKDPKQGVVDANCQVHNISNLFIAGSSVFPTGGHANPTLTIVALAIRLADYVKKQMNIIQ